VAGGEDWVKKSMKKTATGSAGLKKQTKIVMSKALEEDPTVFQYDEVSHCTSTLFTVPVEAEKEIVPVPMLRSLKYFFRLRLRGAVNPNYGSSTSS
jgi:hypothetical protein